MNSPTAQLLRVQNFMLSTDGYGTGEGQSFERPFGHADPAVLASWAGATASWPNRTDPGGSPGLDDYFTRDYTNSLAITPTTSAPRSWDAASSDPKRGAGPTWNGRDGGGHAAVPYTGLRADAPRATDITLSDTTFHFIDAEPMDALRQAKAAADGKDVRLGGGVSTVREFLDADLVDTVHVAVAPVEIGRGGRLWESPNKLRDRFHHERIPNWWKSVATSTQRATTSGVWRPSSVTTAPLRRRHWDGSIDGNSAALETSLGEPNISTWWLYSPRPSSCLASSSPERDDPIASPSSQASSTSPMRTWRKGSRPGAPKSHSQSGRS